MLKSIMDIAITAVEPLVPEGITPIISVSALIELIIYSYDLIFTVLK
jgi:hypothetical protein